ncbi:MAG: cupin domain-containing protein [Nitriliruptorales bacterium]|nr:cupin domain-containing protein [Nitriliruptorales bacterium]
MIIDGQHLQVHYEEIEPADVHSEEGWRKVDIRFLIGSATTGNHDVTMWRARFAPGATHARHTHDVAEVFFLMRGRGAAGTGDREYAVTAGSALYVPPGTVHWFRNPDPVEEAEIIGCYLPGGSLEEAGYHYVGEVTDVLRQV